MFVSASLVSRHAMISTIIHYAEEKFRIEGFTRKTEKVHIKIHPPPFV